MRLIRKHTLALWAAVAFIVALFLPDMLPAKAVSLLQDRDASIAVLYADSDSGGKSEARWIDKDALHWQCRVREGAARRMCGFQLAFPKGLDLRDYHGLRLQLTAQSKNPYLRVYARNFEPGFSTAGDIKTTKFNMMLVPLNDFKQTVTLQFKEFSVAEWWLSAYKVPREYSFPNFNQVVAIGVDLGTPPEIADHEVTVTQLDLIGVWMSRENWYFGLLVAWLIVIFTWGGWQLWLDWRQRARDEDYYQRFMAQSTPLAPQPLAEKVIEPSLDASISKILDLIATWREQLAPQDEIALILLQVGGYLPGADAHLPSKVPGKVAQAIETIVMNHLRQRDHYVRLAEGQFLLVCPLLNSAGAFTQANKICTLAEANGDVEASSPIKVLAAVDVILIDAVSLEREAAQQQLGRCFTRLQTTLAQADVSASRVLVVAHSKGDH